MVQPVSRPRVLVGMLCFLAAWLIVGQTADAAPLSQDQTSPPKWRMTLNCDRAIQKYRGLEYCTGDDGRAHVIVVDLQSAGIQFEYVIAKGNDKDGRFDVCHDVNRYDEKAGKGLKRGGCNDPSNPAYYPVMSLLEASARQAGTAVVVDTDYGAGTQDPRPQDPSKGSREHGPEGLTVVGGVRLDGPASWDFDAPGNNPNTNNAVRRPWLAIAKAAGQDGLLRARLSQIPENEDDGGLPEDWIHTGVGGDPWLIRNGAVDDQARKCTLNQHSCQSTVAQTAVGLSEDRSWLFLVVNREKNATQTGEWMLQNLDVWEAIKFDGGGSSQLWYGGWTPSQGVVTPGDGRLLSQYLAVIAEGGTGIERVRPMLDEDAALAEPAWPALALPGEGVQATIALRNTGRKPWRKADGYALVNLKNVMGAPVRLELPNDTPPGQVARWTFNVIGKRDPGVQDRFVSTEWQLQRSAQPVGTTVTLVVITLPEELRKARESFQRIIDEARKEWEKAKERGEEEMRRQVEQLVRRIAEEIIRQLAPKGPNCLTGLSPVALGLIGVWLGRTRRKEHCNGPKG